MNITKKNITQTKKLLKVILQGSNLQIVPALVGLTGVGKTQAIYQLADELGMELKEFNVAQLQQGDLAMPVAINDTSKNTVKQLVDYNINIQLRDVLNNPDKNYIVFLDEFTRGNISVINELMTIINSRTIQGHKFSSNVRFVLAMNPTSEMNGYNDTEYSATNFDDASAARILMIDVESTLGDWLNWGKQLDKNKETNLHSSIISFFNNLSNGAYFMGKEKDGVRIRSPRTWKYVSDMIRDLEKTDMLNEELLYSLTAAQVGYDVAHVFTTFVMNYLQTIEPKEVFIKKAISKKLKDRFANFEEVKKMNCLDNCIMYLQGLDKEEKVNMNTISIDNFVELWELIESIDGKARILSDWASTFPLQTKYRPIDDSTVALSLFGNKKVQNFQKDLNNRLQK